MKQFLLTLAGVFAGLTLFFIGVPFLLISIALGGARAPTTPPNSVLVLDLRGALTDQEPESLLSLFGQHPLSVMRIVETLKRAESDPRVRGLFVRLPDTGAEGLLPARALGFEYFRHDERRHALIGERSGTKYGLGDILPVRLVEAAPLTGGLRFELTQAHAPAKPQKPKTPWGNRKMIEDQKKRRKKR